MPIASISSGAISAPIASAGDEHALERAEHAAEHLVAHGPLHQRHAGDVDERVPDPEHAHQQDGRRARSARRRSAEPGADQDEADAEVGGEPLPADERER